MELTPGMRYLGRLAASIVFPVIGLILLLLRLLRAFAPGVSMSVGGSIALLVAAFLAILTTTIVSIEVSQRRRAAEFGARLIPRIRGYLPGNVDILFNVIRRAETDYIGSCKSNLIITGTDKGRLLVICISGTAILEQMQLYGPVINQRYLWEDVIVTAEPQNIKVSYRVCRIPFPCVKVSFPDYFGH